MQTHFATLESLKIKILFLFLLSLGVFAHPPFEAREEKLFELIKPRLKGLTKSDQFFKGREYYHYSYDSSRPRYLQRYKENDWWINNEIMFFSSKEGKVSQVAIISYLCGVPFDLENQKMAKVRIQSLLDRETPLLFGKVLKIETKDFKALGPEQRQIRRVPLNAKINGVSKIRLSRGLYKCDGKSGHGHRVDFFL